MVGKHFAQNIFCFFLLKHFLSMCIWWNLKMNKNAAPDNPPCFFEILFCKILTLTIPKNTVLVFQQNFPLIFYNENSFSEFFCQNVFAKKLFVGYVCGEFCWPSPPKLAEVIFPKDSDFSFFLSQSCFRKFVSVFKLSRWFFFGKRVAFRELDVFRRWLYFGKGGVCRNFLIFF